MKIVATGIIKSGKIEKLVFDSSLLCTILKAGDALKEKTPVVVTRVSNRRPLYRGKSNLGNQIIN